MVALYVSFTWTWCSLQDFDLVHSHPPVLNLFTALLYVSRVVQKGQLGRFALGAPQKRAHHCTKIEILLSFFKVKRAQLSILDLGAA